MVCVWNVYTACVERFESAYSLNQPKQTKWRLNPGMDSGRVDTVMLRDSQITIYNLAPKSWQTFLAANAKTINVVHNNLKKSRIWLPMQGTRVWSLVWEVPTCHRATKPVHHSYWACTLEPTGHNYWAHAPQLLKPVHLEPTCRNKRSHHTEKHAHRNEE